MSRLVNKIFDLGYYHCAYNMFHKRFNSSQIIICIDDDETISDYYVKSFIVSKGDLIDSEKAYELMQKDLEILKEGDE